jgi:hypothetical protein
MSRSFRDLLSGGQVGHGRNQTFDQFTLAQSFICHRVDEVPEVTEILSQFGGQVLV